MLPGSCCSNPTDTSMSYGCFRLGSKRFVVPELKPLDEPNSFNCGSLSPLRSQPEVCPAVQTVQARVSDAFPTGFTLSARATCCCGYWFAENFSAVRPSPFT